MKKPYVSIIITAFNEEKNIKKVISDLKKLKKIFKVEIIVVDDGSIDRTKQIAKSSGADTVISYKSNQGKGTAFKKGYRKASGNYVVQIDADYQFMPLEVPMLIEPLLHGFDVSLGTRYEKGAVIDDESIQYPRLFGSYFLSFITSIVAGEKVTDVMAGFKGFKKQAIKNINPKVSHFGYEAEMVIKAAQKKYKIINVPITYKRRLSGKSNVNSIKDGFLVLKTIITTGMKL